MSTKQTPAQAEQNRDREKTQRVEVENFRIDRLFYSDDHGATFESLAEIPGSLTFDPDTLPVFLRLGFLPGVQTLFEGVECLPGGRTVEIDETGWSVADRFEFNSFVDPDRYGDWPDEKLRREGARLFVEAVDKRFESGDDIVVPLSGGMDSRAIVGALREMTESSRIRTVTFGTPGTPEFELGNRAAAVAGTSHVAVDMTELEWSTDRLIETAELTDGNTDLFQPVVWTQLLEEFGTEATFWSGFTGDGVGGSHYEPEWTSRREAAGYILREEVIGEPFYSAPRGWEANYVDWVDYPTKYEGAIANREAMWFERHLERYTCHHLFPSGLDFRVPYMDTAWASFMFSLGGEHREGKRLFNRMMARRFSELFEHPVTGEGYVAGRPVANFVRNTGIWSRKALSRLAPKRVPHPDASYLDYVREMARGGGYRSVLGESLADLRRRGIVDNVRMDAVWRGGNGRNTGAETMLLNLLASLEIILKAFCE